MADPSASPCSTPGECCEAKKKTIEDECTKEESCPEVPGYQSRISSMRKGEDVATFYAEVAKLDDAKRECFEKRRCLLRKYKDTEKDDDACCKGLTGHHLIASATFDGSGYCYNHNQALVLCAAGTSNDVGRHGLMHSMTCVNYQLSGKTSMPVSEMIDHSVDAMKDVFPESDCDWQCIKKELKNSYEGMHESTPAQKKKHENGECKAISTRDELPWHCGYSGNQISSDAMSNQFDNAMNQLQGASS